MGVPERLTLSGVTQRLSSRSVVFASSAVATWARRSLGCDVQPLSDLAQFADCAPPVVVVVGGGRAMDEVKAACMEMLPRPYLVAVPSLWGSGAEVSPVTVLNREGKKVVRVDARNVPDAVCISPDLLATVPDNLARHACGDVWAHVFEALLSPLAGQSLREEASALIRLMTPMPLVYEPNWVEWSQQACLLQASSSVGVVHGMAHILEGRLMPTVQRGSSHAQICATLLAPALAFNCIAGSRALQILTDLRVSIGDLKRIFLKLHDAACYELIRHLLPDVWPEILRDPCTRTNCRLVRPDSLAFFLEFKAGT